MQAQHKIHQKELKAKQRSTLHLSSLSDLTSDELGSSNGRLFCEDIHDIKVQRDPQWP